MKAPKPVEAVKKAHHNPNIKPKPKNPLSRFLSGMKAAAMQAQKSGDTSGKHGLTKADKNKVALNGKVMAVHGSQTIYDQGSEVMYGRLRESLNQTGSINHPKTKAVEKGYMTTLNIDQVQDYHQLKSGNYTPKTLQEQAVVHQMVKKTENKIKTTEEKEPVKPADPTPKASKPVADQKPKEKPAEIKRPQIKPVVSDVNSSSSKKTADKNENFQSGKKKGNDEKKSDNKKLNTKTKGEKDTKVVVPDDIQPVIMPRMDKAVDSEQAEIAPDAQTTINILGLVAAAQEFRDQGVEARTQVKAQNKAARGLKTKIKEVEKSIHQSDDDLQQSEDSIHAKETLVNQLERGLETSVKRQQKVEQEVGTYKQEYQKNKSKSADLHKEATDLLGGSQKHQDPENDDSGRLTQKLRELNNNAATIDEAVLQSGDTVQKLTQEAQQAKAKNAAMQKEALSSKESIRKSKAKLAKDTKRNNDAKKQLEKLNPKLKEAESQSKKLNKEANALLLDSYSIENEVLKTQNAYYKNMATVEGRNSLTQKEKDKIQQAPKELDFAERLLMDFVQLKTQEEQIVFVKGLNPNEQNLLKDKLEQVTANYDNDQSEQQTSIDENVENIRNAQIENFNNKRKDTLQKPMNLVTKNLNRITGLKRLWMSITIAFSGIWNDITSISWTDVGKFINAIVNPAKWAEGISDAIMGIWDDLTNWKGFSEDPVGMILQKAAGIANKVLAIAGIITGILGVLTLAAAVGSIFTLGGLAPLAAWLGGATITMGTITFWIGAIALGLNVLNGIKNIYDIHTAKTAEVLFKNSGELKSDITNSGMAILAMVGGKASQKGGASIKDLAKRNPKTFGKRTFINVKNGFKAKVSFISRKITSVFKKETWMKAAQNFKAAYKKAKESTISYFKTEKTIPGSKKKNLSEKTKQSYNPEQHAEFIDTPRNLGDPISVILTDEQLLDFRKALESADPKVLNEINNQRKLTNFAKSYKDNPITFAESVKNYESFFGKYGWYTYWESLPDFNKSLATIDWLKSEKKLLPTGEATRHELATSHAFTVDGGIVNTPARFNPSFWGEYNKRIYKDLKIALDKLRKVEERNMRGKTVFSGRMMSLDDFELTFKNGNGKEVAFERGMVSSSLDREVAEGFIELSAKNVTAGKKVALIRIIETEAGVYVDDLSDWGTNLGPTRHANAKPVSTMVQREVVMNEGYFRQISDPKLIKTVGDIEYYEIKFLELVKPIK
ncbi:hypothetical protein [Chryseobacterium profundimaris]|uniref:Uncharacterized protein n=1 Tax=Chryseobacterium profundimaris TaxID=1387275 RepID=A0ABY1NN04_9FLAO|nr:hypothetical protein [Chryseobacterium profundimaris]SMP13248.1 hypothetical protein SAMN06264346_102551 [Chryseobacterium profundimaris]